MQSDPVEASAPILFMAGASRGLGLGIAAEFLKRGWTVIGTVRGAARTQLHELADEYPRRVEIEKLDIDDSESIAALARRLLGRRLDMLFINAGTTTREQDIPVGAVTTSEFNRVMLTNALGPMRVIEALHGDVPPDGMIGAMSSGQGSIANNDRGLREVYRASKAALNMSMRSFAARERGRERALLLLARGWIRTDLGGSDAPYTLEESVPLLADIMLAKRKRPGLEYLDRFGETVRW
ncbi:MAG: putative exported short chain dehydrogenase [Bradyrhizobium sp.]|nr:putative exported short chain dehydrogenase [Bradyrhizobium sp.]